MIVSELINQLQQIQDKTTKVYYFDPSREEGDNIHSFNKVSSTTYEIDDVVLLEWED
jgi:hypothetical protein